MIADAVGWLSPPPGFPQAALVGYSPPPGWPCPRATKTYIVGRATSGLETHRVQSLFELTNSKPVPSARRAARALLLRSTSALFLRDAHAPVVVFYQVHAQRSRSSPRQIGRSGVGALFYALLRTVRDFRGWQLSKTPKRCVELIVLDP